LISGEGFQPAQARYPSHSHNLFRIAMVYKSNPSFLINLVCGQLYIIDKLKRRRRVKYLGR
jgi:hypothetical protein